jgi:hypothetical protein
LLPFSLVIFGDAIGLGNDGFLGLFKGGGGGEEEEEEEAEGTYLRSNFQVIKVVKVDSSNLDFVPLIFFFLFLSFLFFSFLFLFLLTRK